MQGKIGCANVLSDLYSMGITTCDNMLMLLASSTDMEKETAETTTKLMIKGFNEQAVEAGTKVTGGQTVRNPWPIIGGVATSICSVDDSILPENAIEGDLLILTKPLGTQLAVNAHQWLHMSMKWERIESITNETEVENAYYKSIKSMSRLNKIAASLMHKYKAHGATDVTGFGILGHATNLAKNQKNKVAFEIHTLPIIKDMAKIDQHINNSFKLLSGLSAETSGGLLICIPQDHAIPFINEIYELEKQEAWIIGRVLSSDIANHCYITPNPTIIEV